MGTTSGWFTSGTSGGGWIAILILLVGVAGIVVLVERLYVIVFKYKNNGRAFIEATIQQVRSGKIDDAIKACAASPATLPDMGLIMLRSRSRDEAELHQIASAATLALVPRLTHHLHYLRTFATAAIMLGVLGTVRGFSAALMATNGTTASLNTQFGLALQPTALGLLVATVLTIGRSYLANQAENITRQIYEFSARLINALTDRPDVRLGHR